MQQGAEYACGRAARAQQQQAFAGQLHAGVEFDVSHQSRAVGVVGVDATRAKTQRVGRTGQRGALTDVLRERKGLELERNGDVTAFGRAIGTVDEVAQRSGKTVQRHQPLPVVQGLARELRETRVNPGRFAVLHRVAHDAVAVDDGVVVHGVQGVLRRVSRVSSRVNRNLETITNWSNSRRIAGVNAPKGAALLAID